jgi:hypothetical protein
MPEWQVTTSRLGEPTPARNAVVEYRATVTSTGVTTSKLSVSTSVPRETTIRAVCSEPEWVEDWRPMEDESDAELTRCALAKLSALLSFGTTHGDSSSSDIVQRTHDRYPDLRATSRDERALLYKSFGVAAWIYEDGTSSWEYEVPSNGEYPPGVRGVPGIDTNMPTVAHAPSLDDLIQSFVLADVRGKIEALS